MRWRWWTVSASSKLLNANSVERSAAVVGTSAGTASSNSRM